MLMADIAHIAGLVVGGAHPSPFPHAHVVTTTTHKTLRGPRGGLILTNDEELAKAINRSVFPGSQGGPLMHIIAAKAVAFGEDLQPEFKTYAAADREERQGAGGRADRRRATACSQRRDGQPPDAGRPARRATRTSPAPTREKALEAAGIITNKNAISNDPRPPKVTSGIRLGTPALTTRGLKEARHGDGRGLHRPRAARQGRRRRAGEDPRRGRGVLQASSRCRIESKDEGEG